MTVRLSRQAVADLRRIVLESEERWGETTAHRTRERLQRRFEAITAGHGYGHKRPDVPAELPLLFVTERPFIIAYDVRSRLIVRILHGKRKFSGLFRRSGESR